MKHICSVPSEKGQNERARDSRRVVVRPYRALRTYGLVVEDGGRKSAPAFRVERRRITPGPAKRTHWTLAAEAALVVDRRDVGRGPRVGFASGIWGGSAQGDRHRGLVVQTLAEASQFGEPVGTRKSVVPCLVRDFKREELVLAAPGQPRETVDERFSRCAGGDKRGASKERPLNAKAVPVVRE